MELAALVVLSTLFVVTHIGMSSISYRQRLVDRVGELGFLGIYSLISLITLGGAIYIYSKLESQGPVLWEMSRVFSPLVFLLLLLAFVLFVLSVHTPSPIGMRPGKSEPKGVLCITRHPMNMGFACFGLAHVIASGTLAGFFLFGAFFAVGFFGAYHQDKIKSMENDPDFNHFQIMTSIFPFGAIVTGRCKIKIEEFSKPLLAIALIGFFVALFMH